MLTSALVYANCFSVAFSLGYLDPVVPKVRSPRRNPKLFKVDNKIVGQSRSLDQIRPDNHTPKLFMMLLWCACCAPPTWRSPVLLKKQLSVAINTSRNLRFWHFICNFIRRSAFSLEFSKPIKTMHVWWGNFYNRRIFASSFLHCTRVSWCGPHCVDIRSFGSVNMNAPRISNDQYFFSNKSHEALLAVQNTTSLTLISKRQGSKTKTNCN